MRRAPHRLVQELAARIEPLETAFHEAWWQAQVTASPATERERAAVELELRRVKGDPSALKEIEHALHDDVHEPILRRELEVLALTLRANQMSEAQREELVAVSAEVESEFASFRPEVGGERLTENDVDEVLRDSNDESQRRAVWTASKEIGERVAGRIRELARLRNAIALDRGFPDYYKMALDLQEMSEPWLFRLLGELDELTSEPFAHFKARLDGRLRERFGVADPLPWHYSDPFFQSLPPDAGVSLDHLLADADAAELAVTTFAGWGIDLRGVIEGSDLYPREHKCQHAFCLDVDRSGRDVRILANVVPGERWVEVMLHESGHAAYDISIDRKLPYLLRRAAHTFVTEAVALLSGRLARDPAWLTKVAKVDEGEVFDLTPRLRSADATHSLLFARWVLVMAHFERDLYADPEADLDEVWWSHVERFQGIGRPDPAPKGAWAAKIHTATAPVYYHNYLLGELLATQLHRTIDRRCGDLVGNAEAGRFLVNDFFHHGRAHRWDRLIELATGKPLSPRDFADSLQAV